MPKQGDRVEMPGVVLESDAWLDHEVGPNRFHDARLGKRFRLVLERLWSCIVSIRQTRLDRGYVDQIVAVLRH